MKTIKYNLFVWIADNTEDKICTTDTNEIFLTNERYTSGGETYLHFYSDASYEGYGFRVRIIQGTKKALQLY